jgi:predicted RNase H-like HicB family nuclease
MLTDYIAAAMKRAKYELLEDGTFFGRIPGFKGVWGNAKTLEDCRRELQETLEGWLILGIENHARLPVVDGISLNGNRPARRRVSAKAARR